MKSPRDPSKNNKKSRLSSSSSQKHKLTQDIIKANFLSKKTTPLTLLTTMTKPMMPTSGCSILLKARQQTNRPFRIASQISSAGASSFPWQTCFKNDRISSKATQIYIFPLVWPTSPPATAQRCVFAGTYQGKQVLAFLSMPNYSGEQQIILWPRLSLHGKEESLPWAATFRNSTIICA